MKTVTGCNQFQSQSCCKEIVPDGTFWTMLGDCVPQIAGFEGQRCRESWHQPWPERQMSCQEVVRVRGGRVPGGDDKCTGFSVFYDDSDGNNDDGKRDSSLAHFPAIIGRNRVVPQPSWSACTACIGQDVSLFIGLDVSPLFRISYLYLYLLAWLWCIGQ